MQPQPSQSRQSSPTHAGNGDTERHPTSGDRRRQDNGDRQPQTGRDLVEQGEQIYDDLRGLAGSLRHAADDWQGLLRRRLERQPYAMLAIAAGAGYVLGGGLPRGVARALLSMAVGQAIQQALPSLAASGQPDAGDPPA